MSESEVGLFIPSKTNFATESPSKTNQISQENIIIIPQGQNNGGKTFIKKIRGREIGTQTKSFADKEVNTDPIIEEKVIGSFLKEITRVPRIEKDDNNNTNIIFRCDTLAGIVNHYFSLNIDGSWLLTNMQ